MPLFLLIEKNLNYININFKCFKTNNQTICPKDKHGGQTIRNDIDLCFIISVFANRSMIAL